MDIGDVFILGGFGLVTYGIYQIFPPAAYIFAGLMLAAFGWYVIPDRGAGVNGADKKAR
jgi:hypothetical protein